MNNTTNPDSASVKAHYLISIEPDGSTYICCGETETIDLYGDVVLGTVEASDQREALKLGLALVPEEAVTEQEWRDNPASMGLSAYRLA